MNCLICKRDAGHRYSCHHCTITMRRWLLELEDYAVIIAATLGPLRDHTRGNTGASFSSRLPIRDDAATLLDYRSGAGTAIFRLRDPRDMDDEPTRSLPGSIHGIAAWIRSEHDHTEPTHWTLVSELRYLRTQLDSCALEPWIDDLNSDLHELHTQARAIAHDQPRPLGHCTLIDCDGLVHWTTTRDRSDRARCVACGRIYTGLDLVRLGVAEEVAG